MRDAAGLTQAELAGAVGIERTALSKIETGARRLDAFELARVAEALGQPVGWLLADPPPAVVSRRAGRLEEGRYPRADLALERVTRDVELLLELGALVAPRWDPLPGVPSSVEEVETAAETVRRGLGEPEGPLTDLKDVVTRVGLYPFSLDLGSQGFDGAYTALEGAGVALIDGSADAGRRRFNLAHELGHHMFADEYATDLDLGSTSEDRERTINAFAIHLLMPRASVEPGWERLHGGDDPWRALLHLSVEYRVSWSAACNQASNLGLIDRDALSSLQTRRPTRADYLDAGIQIAEELVPSAIPASYAQAVLRAYRKRKISGGRAVEMLHGVVDEDELPDRDELPVDELRSEFEPLE